MAVSTRSLAAALADIAGRDRVVDDPAGLAAAAVDGMTPRWVVRAASVDHVARVLALAREETLAVVPRGSGSALDLGSPPDRVDIVLELAGLDRILEDNPEDLTATVEAGCTAGTLGARLASRRQWLPVDPPGGATRTLGGLAATAASGPLRARYGTLRDLLLGVRFVQADGVVTWGGAKVVKSVTGYDVPKLMVGALGTLGVLCELTLRLHPQPEVEATRVLTFGGVGAAAAFVARVIDSSLEPNRVEFLNGVALSRLGLGASATAGVAVSVGSVEAAVRAQVAAIESLAAGEGGRSETPRADFWRVRAEMLEDAGRILAVRVSGPPSRLATVVKSVEGSLGTIEPTVICGCAVLGTLDVVLSPASLASAPAQLERLRSELAEVEGHAIVRRAPVALRRQIDPWGPVPAAAFALMRALRDEFDPTRVLNPGRFVGGL